MTARELAQLENKCRYALEKQDEAAQAAGNVDLLQPGSLPVQDQQRRL